MTNCAFIVHVDVITWTYNNIDSMAEYNIDGIKSFNCYELLTKLRITYKTIFQSIIRNEF